MCSELCKDVYVVYQLEMVAGEVESSCQVVVTFLVFFLVSPYQTIEISLGQPSQLLPPLLIAIGHRVVLTFSVWVTVIENFLNLKPPMKIPRSTTVTLLVAVYRFLVCISGGSRNFQRGFQIPLNFSLAVSRRPKKRSQPAVQRYNCDFKS